MPIIKEPMSPPQKTTLGRAEIIEKIVQCAKDNGLKVARIDPEKGEVTIEGSFKLADLGLWSCYASKVLAEIRCEKTGWNTVRFYGLPKFTMIRLKGPDLYDVVQRFINNALFHIVQ